MPAIELASPTRLLLVGHDRVEFRDAGRMAASAGAQVIMASTVEQALTMARKEGADLALVDVGADIAGFIRQLRRERIGLPVIGCGVNCTADRAVAAIRAGAMDYVPLPPQADLIAAAILSVAVRSLQLIGETPAFRQAIRFALAMARTNAPILISGETGTGRETLARAIHQSSGRHGRFVAVNVAEAGLADDLLEAELFGQEAGAFNGAIARRRGRVEDASGGTLYLGEVGLVSRPLQARLLMLMTERRLRRLGGEEDVWADARIISGTALDLKARVADGAMIPDLLSRLGAVTVSLPPLRARKGDIGPIASHFVERFARAHGVQPRPIAASALEMLMAQPWPGNLRELEYAMLRALMMAQGAEITAADLTLADGSPMRAEPAPPPPGAGKGGTASRLVGRTVADVERELILSTLEQCRGNRTTASAILGISVRTMRNKLKSFVDTGMPAVAPQ
jgi:two-component system, NtrC family, response regulator HydG